MAEKTLSQQADTIIMQSSHTREDIRNLHKIKRKMARSYKQYKEKYSELKRQYDSTHNKKYIECRKIINPETGKKYNNAEAQEIANFYVDAKFGDYKVYEETAKGMLQEISAIRDFCIDYYTGKDSELDAIVNDLD